VLGRYQVDARTELLDPRRVNRRDRQERWFADGAAALRRTLTALNLPNPLPPTGDFYTCPCCLMAYGRDALDQGILTDEHVPPRAVGGRKLLLTCADCNSSAGSALDAHAERREAIQDFLTSPEAGRALSVEVAVGDNIIRGAIRRIDDAWVMQVAPKANHPRQVEEATRTLSAWAAARVAADGRQIGLRFTERMITVRAQLSWVRAAYLAAFAALGWRYVFLRYLDPLRAQLAAPTENVLPPLAMIDPTASAARRQMLVIQEPGTLRGLAVVLGRYTVFLPWVEEPQSFDALSAALAEFSDLPTPRPRYVGKQIAWPVKPLYALDRVS
jgi:hypothetical protein